MTLNPTLVMTTEKEIVPDESVKEQNAVEHVLDEPVLNAMLGFYAKDVYATLLEREAKIPKLDYASPQLECRPAMVEWICSTCHCFKLQLTCRHLAITLLDIFMDYYIVDEEQLELLALCCIQIAAKFEEREVNIPRLKEFSVLTKTLYCASLYRKMELQVLKHMNYEVGIPTVAHFSYYYASMLVDSTDKVKGESLNDLQVNAVFDVCKEYFFFLVSIPLHDIMYWRYRPSVLGCAVTAAVRKLVDLDPLWPARLEEGSGISKESFEKPMADILATYEIARAKQETSANESDLVCLESPVDTDEDNSSSGYISGGSSSAPDINVAEKFMSACQKLPDSFMDIDATPNAAPNATSRPTATTASLEVGTSPNSPHRNDEEIVTAIYSPKVIIPIMDKEATLIVANNNDYKGPKTSSNAKMPIVVEGKIPKMTTPHMDMETTPNTENNE